MDGGAVLPLLVEGTRRGLNTLLVDGTQPFSKLCFNWHLEIFKGETKDLIKCYFDKVLNPEPMIFVMPIKDHPEYLSIIIIEADLPK